MALDSSTLCARTSSGDAELATPSQGLSLGQRRVLVLLQNPVAVGELAQQHRLEPEKLARDLTRLAELRLVILQGPSIASAPPPTAVTLRATSNEAASMAPVVIGRSARRASSLPLVAGAAALVVAAAIWYGTRANPAPAEVTKPTATASTLAAAPAALAPVLMPPAVNAVNAVSAETSTEVPAPALILREKAAPVVARPQVRTEAVAAAPAAAKVAPAPDTPEPKAAQRPEANGNAPASASAATAQHDTPTPAAAFAPAPAVEAPPPVQLAAAAPSSAAQRPAASSALKPVSREPPDFPKEAIADGYRSGIVNARIHVDARGSVAGVEIIGSQPPKVFDRAARRALLRWQFEPNAAGQSADLDVDVKFQRD